MNNKIISLDDFLAPLQSLIISSLDENNNPFSSYAPFIKYNNKYYTYLSLMAKHSKNLIKNEKSSIFFCEDEKETSNIFTRKRVVIQCNSKKIEQNTALENEILNKFREKFKKEMIDMLYKMGDFYLFEFTPFYGEAVFGFGKAYNLGGENFDEIIQRDMHYTNGHGKK